MSSQDLPRSIPSIPQLHDLVIYQHALDQRHRLSGILDSFCPLCQSRPRTLRLACRWVETEHPLLAKIVEELPKILREKLQEVRGITSKRRDFILQLGWCVREADHMQASEEIAFTKQLEKWTSPSVPLADLYDLTYLPSWDQHDLDVARSLIRSSSQREHRVHEWQRRGINRIRDDVTSQRFWMACAVPLTAVLKNKVRGRKTDSWKSDDRLPIPDALWQEIISLWQLRYPNRRLPSPGALRNKVTIAAPFLFQT